jgi:hypothetical protein
VTLIDYALKNVFKELPAGRWEGQSDQGPVTVTEHKAGVDIFQGPWVKFKFKYNSGGGEEYEAQGYERLSGGDRIKFGKAGAVKETEDDKLDETFAGDLADRTLIVIIKMTFEQDGKLHSLRFAGRTNN